MLALRDDSDHYYRTLRIWAGELVRVEARVRVVSKDQPDNRDTKGCVSGRPFFERRAVWFQCWCGQPDRSLDSDRSARQIVVQGLARAASPQPFSNLIDPDDAPPRQ